MAIPNHLILFDGVCGLCNSIVDFIIKQDKNNLFLFSQLQSVKGKEALELTKNFTINPNSIVYIENGKSFYKSTAVLKIFYRLGGFYQLLYFFILVPPFIRNFFYTLISNSRYKLFGKTTHCMLPDDSIKSKFL